MRAPLALVAPLRTATGDHASRVASLVEVTTSDGVIGWGENVAPEGAFYTGETAADSYSVMRDVLAPLLLDREIVVSDMLERWWGVDGWRMAKHALESAVWDAQCRREGTPLATALGGAVREVRVGAVVGLGATVAETVAECERRVAEGYTRVKVKIAPGRDAEVVRAVRAAIPGTVELDVDANGSYGAGDIDRLVSLCGEGVGLIEQPFARDDLGSHAALAAATGTIVGLDESIESLAELRRAMESGACGAVNVKPSKMGGLGEARAIAEVCRSHGIAAWVGGMLESAVGRASALALATHPGCTLTPDLSASDRYFRRDVAGPFEMSNGCLRVPSGPGLGLTPDPEVLSMGTTTIETVRT